MMIVRFKSSDEHQDLLHKIKKMKKFTDELEEMLEECYDDGEPEFRGKMYRKEYDEDDMMHGRYGYRRGMK